jgi:hypothetical protein
MDGICTRGWQAVGSCDNVEAPAAIGLACLALTFFGTSATKLLRNTINVPLTLSLHSCRLPNNAVALLHLRHASADTRFQTLLYRLFVSIRSFAIRLPTRRTISRLLTIIMPADHTKKAQILRVDEWAREGIKGPSAAFD